MLSKRLIKSNDTGGGVCLSDETDIFGDGSGVALYQLNWDGSDMSGNYDGVATDVSFVNGKIDSGIFYNQKESDLKALYKSLKGKEFDNMRKWVVNNSSVQPADLFKTIYSSLKEYLQPTSIPQAILLLAGYQYKSAFVADQEINMVACLTEIMATCKFK